MATFTPRAGGLCHDPTDDGLIFQVRLYENGTLGSVWTAKWRADAGLVWKTEVPFQIVHDGSFFGQSRLVGQRWTLYIATRLIQLDTATGAIVTDETWPAAVQIIGAHTYDAQTDTLIVHVPFAGWARLFLNRGGGQGATLSAIVADLCGRAGLGLADLDTSELTDTVPGYVIGRQTTIRGGIEPLAQAYFFEAVESDDVLAFRKRGRSPVATLPADLLLPLDAETGESWRERRAQEVDLPERVSVAYMDTGTDYQQGSQQAKRISAPVPTQGRSVLNTCRLHELKCLECGHVAKGDGVSGLGNVLGAIEAQDVEGEAADPGEDPRFVSNAACVFAEGDVAGMMVPVLDTPVSADRIRGGGGQRDDRAGVVGGC